jgi:hypothetical protein
VLSVATLRTFSCRAPGDTRINYTVEISPHGGILPKQLTARLHTGVRCCGLSIW